MTIQRTPQAIAWRIILGFVFLLTTSYVVSKAFSLMNYKSDIAVGGGIVILLGIASVYLMLAIKFGRILWRKLQGDGPRFFGHTLIVALMMGLSMTYLTACGCTIIEPGHVGVLVNMTGDARGVDDLPALTGWQFYNPATQRVYEWPTFVQTAVWTRDETEGSPKNEEVSFNTKEGLIVTGDISLSYQLIAERVPYFYVKFRSDDMESFTHGYLRNVARDVFNEIAGAYSVEEIYGVKKEEFLQKVRERINRELETVGVVLQQFGFIGAPRPPEQVTLALNGKVAATQKAMQAENELREAQAQAKKAVAKATGEAEANRLLAESISPELVRWRMIEVTQRAIDKWNGVRPMVEGSGGGLLLQIPLPQGAQAPESAPQQ